jgi:hypothetical protein
MCWGDPTSPGDDAYTGRRVYFIPQRVIAAAVPVLAHVDPAPRAE